LALALGAGASRAAPIADRDYAPPSWPATYKSHGPAVLFDEAHHNFHTPEAGYMPFVRLITHDGYRVRVKQGADRRGRSARCTHLRVGERLRATRHCAAT